MGLASQIVSGEEANADNESVEQVFAQARDAEATSEEFLVDDGWKAVGAEPEPVVVESQPEDSNRYEFVVNPVAANGNEHREEPAGRQ